MNFNEMQNLWNSPRNNPAADEHQQLAGQFARQMIRRRRFQSIWLINMFVWLVIITAVVVWSFVAGQIDTGLEWGVFPLLLLPWGAAVFFLRRHLKPASTVTGGRPVTDSFRAALQSNQTERTNLKLAAGFQALLIPVLALVMQQLHAVGKVSGRELTSMGLFFGVALLAGLGGMAAWYFGRLQPQQKRLEILLAELSEEQA